MSLPIVPFLSIATYQDQGTHINAVIMMLGRNYHGSTRTCPLHNMIPTFYLNYGCLKVLRSHKRSLMYKRTTTVDVFPAQHNCKNSLLERSRLYRSITGLLIIRVGTYSNIVTNFEGRVTFYYITKL